MMPNSEAVQNELARRYRTSTLIVGGFLVMDIVLLAVAFFASDFVFRPGDPGIIMGLWIAVLVFGLGAFVVRRTKLAAMRLQDIAAVKGVSALLKTLQETTVQVAAIGGAIALMGFMITILTGDWTNMLRASGVAAIVLIYAFPFKSAWQRVVMQLAREESSGGLD